MVHYVDHYVGVCQVAVGDKQVYLGVLDLETEREPLALNSIVENHVILHVVDY